MTRAANKSVAAWAPPAAEMAIPSDRTEANFCWENFCGVVANVLDCDIIVREFKIQWCYKIHFQTNTLGKGKNSLFLQDMGLVVKLLFL